MQRLGIAGRQVRAPGGAAQQRVAREHAVGEHERDRVLGVPRRVDGADAQPPGDERLAVVDPHVDDGRELARCMTRGTPSRRASSRAAEK